MQPTTWSRDPKIRAVNPSPGKLDPNDRKREPKREKLRRGEQAEQRIYRLRITAYQADACNAPVLPCPSCPARRDERVTRGMLFFTQRANRFLTAV